MQVHSRQALSKLKDDKTPLFRLENVHADFKEPFILFVRAIRRPLALGGFTF
ncbi:hypothetical protein HpBT140_05850 [Helicobacter pylori]